jgi:aryl-alcohol dehydrogenase-like predicted oxidoreductase
VLHRLFTRKDKEGICTESSLRLTCKATGWAGDVRLSCGRRPPSSIRGSAVEYRQLGRSGLRVSVIALGTMTFGASGDFTAVGCADVHEASRILGRCLDAGVNLVDTADIYSSGATEEMLGQIIKPHRDDVILATKCRLPTRAGPNGAGSSRHHLVRSVEASLRRLGTDHIDLYQLHEWDGETPLEETLGTLDALVAAGKVRYIGCSNYSCWHLMKALATSERCQFQRFVSHQIYWSLIGREAEWELVPAAIDQGIGVLVYSPLAGGLLTGKYRRGRAPESSARHLTDWGFPPVYDRERTFGVIEGLVGVAEARGLFPSQVALAWLRGKPGLTSLVVGARNERQIAETLAAADLQLSAEERLALDTLSAVPLPYPYWHHSMTARDRLSPADRSLLG